MSKRIKIISNALVVEDTITGAIDFDKPSRDIWYNTDLLDEGNILFIEKDGSNKIYQDAEFIPLADAVDSTDTSFNATTFRAFVHESLGFKTAGGSSPAQTEGYQRPADWLEIDSLVVDGDEKFETK